METAAIMAIIGVFSVIANIISSSSQQDKEFQQQQDLLNQQQHFSQQQTEWLWEHQRPQQVMSDYLDLGFNPNLAAASIMGVGSETAQGASSPSAPSVNSAIDALQRSIGQGGQSLYDIALKNAQISNINADTNLKDIESGIMPKDFELRKLSTDEQIKVWQKSVDKMAKEMDLDDAMRQRYMKEVENYDKVTNEQIKVWQQQVKESIQRCKESEQRITNLQKDLDVKDSEIAFNYNSAYNQGAQGVKAQVETEGAQIANDRQQIAFNFEKTVDAPLTADDKKYVQKLILEGKYDEVEQFYLNLFNIHTHQDPPKTKINIPFGIYGSEKYDSNYGDLFRRNGTSGLTNAPIFNPRF